MRSIFSGLKRLGTRSLLLRRYLKQYKKRIIIGSKALATISALEATLPLIVKRTVDTLSGSQEIEQLRICALSYFSVALVLALCRFTWRFCLASAGALAGKDLRKTYVSFLLHASQSFYAKHKTGDLTSLANNDIESIRNIYDIGIVILIDALFGLITIPAIMFYLAPRQAAFVLLPLLLIPFLAFYNDRRIHRYFRAAQEAFSLLTSRAQESLLGIGVLKSFAKEDIFLRRYTALGSSYVEKNHELIKIEASIGPMLEATVVLAVILHLFIGGSAALANALSLGTFVAFLRYLQQLAWPMQAVGLAVAITQKALVSSDRLTAVISEKSDLEILNPAQSLNRSVSGGAISFKNVSFAYPNSDQIILKNINLEIFKGERIAILGDVGSGKSTLLSLIPRLYNVSEGEISIDGINIGNIELDKLRGMISFVPQEPFLFRKSIKENIAYGVSQSPQETDGAYLEEMAHIAQIHGEIITMPEAYSTQMGERGVNVSGGQKQRLSIARALFRNSSILIFDDALSAIDIQAEARIMARLAELPRSRTEIFAGHRLSTIKVADRIIVLSEGRIVQEGSHAELIKRTHEWYWRFYEEQRLEEELEENEGLTTNV